MSWFGILGVSTVGLCSILPGKVSLAQPLKGWGIFEEIADATRCSDNQLAFAKGIGEVVQAPDFAFKGSSSLRVWANKAGSIRSNHVIAQKKVSDEIPEFDYTATYRYELYAYIDPQTATAGQAGPEFSMQNTHKNESGEFKTTTAGIQYQASPYTHELNPQPGSWTIWSEQAPGKASWEIFMTQPLLPGEWYYIAVAADFKTNKYVRFWLRGGGVNLEVDLSEYSIAQEEKFTDEAFWLTLESENLWNNCGTAGAFEYKVYYDDVKLSFITLGEGTATKYYENFELTFALPSNIQVGTVIDAMEDTVGWRGEWDASRSANRPILTTVAGHNGQALQLSYDLGTVKGGWAQFRRDFDPPRDFSAGDHIRFFYRGTARNTLEIGLVSGDGQNYFGTSWNTATHVPWWTYATWDFQDFRKDGQPFPNFSQVKAIFISVANKDTSGDGDVGGEGSLTIDELQILKIASRPKSETLGQRAVDSAVLDSAAKWIAAQQQDSGLLKSWQEEVDSNAWLYDQALGILVLCETDATRANKLAGKLLELQQKNGDGSWYEGYNYFSERPLDTKKPVGAIAWTVYALMRYALVLEGSQKEVARQGALKGADWLATLQRSDGSLPGEVVPGKLDTGAPTEPNLDGWWAFQATGQHQKQTDRLRAFLLDKAWDSPMGRFKASPNAYQIFLDNQTWGAAFLRAVGRLDDAQRALSYAQWNLVTPSSDGVVCGLDGGGPFSVWNEGTLQYIAEEGENSGYYWNQMVGQLEKDGLPGSPDNFNGYSVWLTKMHGVAPTAWLYFAGTGGPFHTFSDSVKTAVLEEHQAIAPQTFALEQNYPNPFNSSTVIRFVLPVREKVKLTIYNLAGQKVKSLVEEGREAGVYTVPWDGRDHKGIELASGVYLYCLQAGKQMEVHKLLLLR